MSPCADTKIFDDGYLLASYGPRVDCEGSVCFPSAGEAPQFWGVYRHESRERFAAWVSDHDTEADAARAAAELAERELAGVTFNDRAAAAEAQEREI
jgi:hypothetical protein